jgi:hypothetical protein
MWFERMMCRLPEFASVAFLSSSGVQATTAVGKSKDVEQICWAAGDVPFGSTCALTRLLCDMTKTTEMASASKQHRTPEPHGVEGLSVEADMVRSIHGNITCWHARGHQGGSLLGYAARCCGWG